MALDAPLHAALAASERRHPHRTAIEEPGQGAISYAELSALSDRVRDRLACMGVRPGDRVGLCVRKSIDAIAAIFGVLRAGAAYVPVDPSAPPARAAYVLADCGVRAAIVEDRVHAALVRECAALGAAPRWLLLGAPGGGRALDRALRAAQERSPALPAVTHHCGPEDVAYVLYTSGSTGRPKGVVLSHQNATSFVSWCSEAFAPTPDDRFSSHAPLHFDLSILDLFLCCTHGATLVLVDEETGKDPARLALLIAERKISIWYSAPSILSLLCQSRHAAGLDYASLRLVLFAGEVFAVKHLRALTRLWPHPRYFNLYGPTETNVCTYHEIPTPIAEERSEPFPIGTTCSHLRTRVVDARGADVTGGEPGELLVSGPGVMSGYWNLPEQNERAFVRAGSERFYRTGDIVRRDERGAFVFLGRRDRMVKRRGYRIELGEIEAKLYEHPAIEEAAVIALADEQTGVRIEACLACPAGRRPSLIELKRFCAENLPLYMVPDAFAFYPVLPKTSTDKIDYEQLKRSG